MTFQLKKTANGSIAPTGFQLQKTATGKPSAIVPITPVDKESATSKFLTGVFGSTISTFKDIFSNPVTTLTENPNPGTHETVLHSLGKPIADNINSFIDHIETTFGSNKTASERTGAGVGAVTNLLNFFMSPITLAFHAAERLPLGKNIASAVNLPFAAIGDTFGATAKGVVDILPISDTAKNNIKEPFADLASLAGQVLVGGKIAEKTFADVKTKYGEDVANKMADTAHTIVNDHKDNIIKQAKQASSKTISPDEVVITPEPQVKTEIPKNNVYDANGFRPVQTDEILPNGYTTKVNTQTGEQMTNAPFKEKVTPNINTEQSIESNPISKIPPETNINPKSGLAENLVNEAQKQNIELPNTEIPTYKTRNIITEDLPIADKFVNENPEIAKQIVNGEVDIPKDVPLLKESVYTALKNKALRERDIETLMNLKDSKINVEATELGQRIKAFDDGLREADPIKIAKAIESSNVDNYKKFNKNIEKNVKDLGDNLKKESDRIKKETVKKVTKKQTLVEFINSIKC